MEPTTCLICNESVAGGGGKGAGSKKSKNSDTPPPPQLISDAKSKFALTSSQYTILQKVLSLPEGTCKTELMGGPYCRECFTNINNVCHIMSALENLQESIQEFRKDFGTKMSVSMGDQHETFSSSGRKRRSVNTGPSEKWNDVRKILLDCLRRNSFVLGNVGSTHKSSPGSNKAKHLHDIISEFDPDSKPETNVKADLVLRTTNGNMPVMARTKKLTYKAQTLQSEKQAATVYSKSRSNSVSSSRKGGFTCSHQTCKQKFASQSALNVHSERVHLDSQGSSSSGDYVCWYCSREFRSDDELKTHEREHTTSRKCPICHKTFGRVNYLNLHMMSHSSTNTPVAPPKPKRRTIVKSTKSVAPSKSKTKTKLTGNWPKCDVCYKVFPNKKCMLNHRSREHSQTGSAGTVSKAKLVVLQSNSGKAFRPARCKICVKIVMDLPSHMKSTHPGVAYTNGNKDKTNTQSTTPTTVEHDSSKARKPGPASLLKNKLVVDTKESEPSQQKGSDLDLSRIESEDTEHVKVKEEKDSAPAISEEIPSSSKLKTENYNGSDTLTKASEEGTPSIKAEEDRSQLKSNSPVAKKGIISTVNCLLPPPLPSFGQGSKYQFKNLLKIGEDRKEEPSK